MKESLKIILKRNYGHALHLLLQKSLKNDGNAQPYHDTSSRNRDINDGSHVSTGLVGGSIAFVGDSTVKICNNIGSLSACVGVLSYSGHNSGDGIDSVAIIALIIIETASLLRIDAEARVTACAHSRAIYRAGSTGFGRSVGAVANI